MNLLTKSKYLIGLQCPKYLWTIFHEKEKIPKVDVATQKMFDEGNKVGGLAKELFPDGKDLPTSDFTGNIKLTKSSLQEGKPLFEPGFLTEEGLYSRGDILVPNGDSWDIIEVKSGTRVKDVNVHDVSFQKYVYELSGLKIKGCFLLHLNNEYIKKGKININELFVKEDITKQVEEAIIGIKERIEGMFEIINADKPEKDIGNHCKNPYECPLDCWKDLPENHVFCLYRGGKLSCELYDNGVVAIKDIPDDIKLNDRQGIQRDCEIQNKVHVHKESIKHFLKGLQYPLYYLDFETFNSAIPMFDGLKPYSQVCFQFSLHVVEKEGDEPKHYEFIYDGNEDPREEFVIALKKVLGDKGSVIVYNQSFEINRLKELGELFPEHKDWVENVLTRIVDLLVPFRNFSYYNPKQQGSASIKKVLPALCGKSYAGMEIADGGSASVEFFNMAYNKGKDVREALLKYCELDTLAEVMMVEKLKELIS